MGKPPEKANSAGTKPSPIESDLLADEIAKRLSSLVPGPQRSQVVAQVISLVKEETFSGPLPHPRHFREYNEALPGCGDRMLAMVEADLAHDREMQRIAIEADIADMREGRRLGFAALVLLIVGSIICGAMGHEAIAFALLGATVVGVIGTLIKGRGKKPD